MPTINHHGAVTGVTGSCHQYTHATTSVLIDCGLFQGSESNRPLDEFDFQIETISALIVTHCHIDHVGRIPWLIAAGFKGPIYCTEPTTRLLPLVLEDALGIHIPNDQTLVEQTITRIKHQLRPIPYNEWHPLPPNNAVQLRFQSAGHIMGSAYVELDADGHRTIFSGDLGAPGAVFVDEPSPPQAANTLILESTYGDKNHEHRASRKHELAEAIKRSLEDGGSILIPAFSLGRTQEILAFIEELLFEQKLITENQSELPLPVILDSPLAQTLTDAYRNLKPHWRQTLQNRLQSGRYPLAFDQLITIQGHREHLKLVNRLAKTGQPAIILAASGMCQGGRIVNYLQAMIDKPETDILFVGYQAKGTVGRAIQQAKPGERIKIFDETRPVNARIHRLSGFSAHADQTGLLNFATGIPQPPEEIRLVHGDPGAKRTLKDKLERVLPGVNCHIPVA